MSLDRDEAPDVTTRQGGTSTECGDLDEHLVDRLAHADAPAPADGDDFAFLEEPGVPDTEPDADFDWLREDSPNVDAIEEAEATLIEEDGGVPAPEPAVEAVPESIPVEELELPPEDDGADDSFAWLDQPVEPEP